MANSAGVSGPFNPAIGLGTAQQLVIGVAAANLAATITAGKWQNAALGNFIGQQTDTTAHPTAKYSQAQGQAPVDFDGTFTCKGIVAMVPTDTFYTKVLAQNQFSFEAAGGP